MTCPSPTHDCALCPRLAAYRATNQQLYPSYHNAPVPSFGDLDAALLVVGLAPGLQGANATGRPFTGDYAGDLLYQALLANGLAEGVYDPGAFGEGRYARAGEGGGDGLRLINTRITNAVRCLPPDNMPSLDEIKTCNQFLQQEMAAMPRLRVALTLGRVAHDAVFRALNIRHKDYPFGHGAMHQLPSVVVLNSYHCSRYNVNTGRLTYESFASVLQQALPLLAL